MDEFPSNSNRQKASPPEKKIEKLISGDAVRKKPSRTRRIREMFLSGEDPTDIRERLIYDIIVPGAKNILLDAITQGSELTLLGSTLSSRRSGGRRPGHVSEWVQTPYGTVSRGSSPRPGPSRDVANRTRANHTFDDIVIPTRAEAEIVLDGLFDLLSKYEVASVADFYGMVDISSMHTDQKWGWTELRGSTIERVREGYVLNLPKPQPLK